MRKMRSLMGDSELSNENSISNYKIKNGNEMRIRMGIRMRIFERKLNEEREEWRVECEYMGGKEMISGKD